MKNINAEIIAEYGPFPGVEQVHGVTFDGERVWFAYDKGMIAFDPASKKEVKRFDVPADAGTTFDGTFLWQIAGDRIQKIDPKTGKIEKTIPSPGKGKDSGLTYAEGALWVGQYREKKIHKMDPETGEVLKTLESDRFVTGVTFAEGDLWHGTIDGDQSDIRRVDERTGEVLERLTMPKGVLVSGLEASGDRFYAGTKEKVRAIKRPRKAA
jgi:glutamine cyclotransferase